MRSVFLLQERKLRYNNILDATGFSSGVVSFQLLSGDIPSVFGLGFGRSTIQPQAVRYGTQKSLVEQRFTCK